MTWWSLLLYPYILFPLSILNSILNPIFKFSKCFFNFGKPSKSSNYTTKLNHPVVAQTLEKYLETNYEKKFQNFKFGFGSGIRSNTCRAPLCSSLSRNSTSKFELVFEKSSCPAASPHSPHLTHSREGEETCSLTPEEARRCRHAIAVPGKLPHGSPRGQSWSDAETTPRRARHTT